jgi:hypothetical protein
LERFLRELSLIAEHSRIPRNVFWEKSPRHTMQLDMRFALFSREEKPRKSVFFSNFSKLERFLRELSTTEGYNRNPVHGINIKRHSVILETQSAHLELVNPPRLAQHFPQKPLHPRQPEHTLPIIDIRRYPNTTLSPPAPDSPSYANLLAMFMEKTFPTVLMRLPAHML